MKEMELYDIYSTWHVPFWQTFFFKMGVAGIIVAGLIVIIVWYIVRSLRKRYMQQLNSMEQALLDIQTCRAYADISREQAQLLYSKLIIIMKLCLAHHTGRPMDYWTDDQVLEWIHAHVSSPYRPDLITLFEYAPTLKFSYAKIESHQLNHFVDCAARCINHIIESSNTLPESHKP